VLSPAIDWLLDSGEPLVRYRALVELAGASAKDGRAVDARRRILDGPIVRTLLTGPADAVGSRRHPYSKWGGAHWRLVSLMDLGVPPENVPGVPEQIEPVFGWLTGRAHRRNVPVIRGLARRCASIEGNALAVAVHFGLAGDPRSKLMADGLVAWQWPDGGWNCDRREEAHHASFHETHPAMRGLAAFGRATGDASATAAANRAAEFILRHRVCFRERTGDPLSAQAVKLHYPPYWHYDFFAGLRVLTESGHVQDPRATDALDLLEKKRQPDGRWAIEAVHFRKPGSKGPTPEVIDWGLGQPSEPVTLAALQVLRAAGRLT